MFKIMKNINLCSIITINISKESIQGKNKINSILQQKCMRVIIIIAIKKLIILKVKSQVYHP